VVTIALTSTPGPEHRSAARAQASASVVDDARSAGPATPVGIIALDLQEEILVNRQFLGRIEATREANIGFEFGGTIAQINVREGDPVQAGDVLARLTRASLTLERTALEASLTAARSRLDLANSEVNRVERLVRSGAATSSSLDQVLANRDTLNSTRIEVETALAQVDLRLRNTELIAPFDGIVGATTANIRETVAAGQPVVSIFESGGANFRVGLPISLDPAGLRDPRIAVAGRIYNVTLDAVRPDIDFRTNTRTAIFRLNAEDMTSFGLSATLSGQVALPLRGAWVPIDAMRPSAMGYWILLAVGEDGIADPIAVEVEHLRGDEAYVSGAFDAGTRIIHVGAHKVVPGQSVRTD